MIKIYHRHYEGMWIGNDKQLAKKILSNKPQNTILLISAYNGVVSYIKDKTIRLLTKKEIKEINKNKLKIIKI